jgi:hypothetical protein
MKKARGEAILTVEKKMPEAPSPWPNRVLAFAPFGISQFLNGHSTKGALILTGQVAFLGMNIGAYWWKQGVVAAPAGAEGSSAVAEYNGAQAFQFAAIGLFAAVYIYSIVDALLN